MSGEGVRIERVDRLEARYCEYDWPWARDNTRLVEERWRLAVAERPKLFDGIVLLARDVAIEAGTLRTEFFPVRFAPFMAFRDLGYPDPGIVNCFALAALADARGVFCLA